MITAGIDIGSLTAKAVVLDSSREAILGRHLEPTGHRPADAGAKVLKAAVENAGIDDEDVEASVGTGYGRVAMEGVDWRITEISCHARGAWYLSPGVNTVFDIGGQDAKVIRVDGSGSGNALDFEMNDRCAAGTGRFFEVMAEAIEVNLEELGELAAGAEDRAELSSTCTVFAESEVVGLLADEHSIPSIAAGLCDAVARRIIAMANRLTVEPPIVLCGGVAHNVGVREALERHLNQEVAVPNCPQLVGAVGAAVLAEERMGE